MSRPLRHAPPIANRGLIVRPRLLALLQSRFERPVTAIVAAAGFGKTTLLSQAVAENALSPLGEDLWLTCQRDDTTLSFLAGGAYAAVGLKQPVPESAHHAAVAVTEAMWSEAPRHMALILDDAHLIEADSPGFRFLTHLVEELPGNGHIVLASRPPMPVLTTRLLASGEAIVLREQDLQFRDEEMASFADCRGVPVELLGDVGGWPALAELTATAGPAAVTGYVWEELLTRLTPERRHALALLAEVGGADEEIAAALLGHEVNLLQLLDGLPLVVQARSGWWSLHPLWSSALQHHLDMSQVTTARRTAAAILRRRRQYHDAIDLLVEAGAWDDVRELIVEVCSVFTSLVPPDALALWLHRLPMDVQKTPEGLLLMAMVVEPASPGAAEQLLEDAFAAAPDLAHVRYACLNALVLLAFWRADAQQMKHYVERLQQLADRGHTEAPTLLALLRALLTSDTEQIRAELTAPGLVSGAPLSPVQDWLHAHIVLRRLGDPVRAEPLARRALAHGVPTMQAQCRCELLESLRLSGRLAEASGVLADLLGDLHTAAVLTSPELLTCAVVLLSILGRHEQAEQLMHDMRSTVTASPVAWAPIALAIADAFHQVSVGEEDQAVIVLRAALGHGVARSRAVVQVSPTALPLLYVLVPEVRARWDASPPPGCFIDTQRVARALVELREQGSLAGVQALPPHARRLIACELPIPWAAELALAMVASGHDDGRVLLRELGPEARNTLRSQSQSPVAILGVAARVLLREFPAVPAYRLQLQALGPFELRRDGELVVAPELRRERVRQLLAHMVVHGRATRSAIADELWPDLDEAAASRNLRVTLAYLQNVLEPDRHELDPPYFLQTIGPVLQLTMDGALEIDALLFERHIDEAAALERQGALSTALVAYQRAVQAWSGNYFADTPVSSALELERDRLRAKFVAAAVRAGNLLLARGDVPQARGLAERSLRVDEWSEPAYQLLIAVDLAAGDLAAAHRTLGRCHRMLRELGVPAHPQTLQLGRQLQASR